MNSNFKWRLFWLTWANSVWEKLWGGLNSDSDLFTHSGFMFTAIKKKAI